MSFRNFGATADVRTLVDTSAWVETLRKDGKASVKGVVEALTREGDALLCELILLELWNGARGTAERKMIRRLEQELTLLPITSPIWHAAYNLASDCRAAGVTVPATDLLIAQCAAYYKVRLVHHDAHFEQIASVQAKRQG